MKDSAMETPVKRFLTLALTALLGCIAQTALAENADRPVADTADTTEVLDTSFVSTRAAEKQISGLMSGNLSLDMSMLSTLPKFLGTNDIMKTLQLMPGIQTSGELDSGIYIRGGDAGHSAIMLDGATVYNPAHLMGFFSIFNSDHLKSSTLYKSDIPAKYGGRLGGVVDISVKDELLDRVEGDVNVGLLSSQATLGIPIGKKSAMYLSGRASYFNYMLSGIARVMNGAAAPDYFFQDWNITLLTRLAPNNTLKINGYYGHDRLHFMQETYSMLAALKWYNAAASIIWEGTSGERTRNRHILSFSRYSNNISIERDPASIKMPSDITDFSYKGLTELSFRQSRLSFGGSYTFHLSNVQYPIINGLNSLIDDIGRPAPYHTHEFGIFADYSIWFNFPLTLDIGLRYSGASTGKRLYTGPEPRFSIRYRPTPQTSLRAAFAIQRQYVNMVSISGMGMPTDYWTPVTDKIRPQISESASLGFSHLLWDSAVEYSIEPYFCLLDNVLEYDGELFDMVNRKYDPEEHVISGKGRNYGIEIMLKKNGGKINGWISYTLSRSERSFPDIMDGAVFPAKHDRTHNLAATASYSPAKRWLFSAVFVYATGRAYTPPVGIYLIGENMIQEYGDHNSARMPDYHRLDLSVTYNFRQRGRCRHSLNASIYNVYARKNPLYRDLRFNANEDTGTFDMSIKNISLYSIVPSISYTLNF